MIKPIDIYSRFELTGIGTISDGMIYMVKEKKLSLIMNEYNEVSLKKYKNFILKTLKLDKPSLLIKEVLNIKDGLYDLLNVEVLLEDNQTVIIAYPSKTYLNLNVEKKTNWLNNI